MKSRYLILPFLFLSSGMLGAQTVSSKGKVIYVKGTVQVLRSGETQGFTKGDNVSEEDQIQTGKNSTVVIDTGEGVTLKVTPQTKITLNRFSRNQNSYNVQIGGVFAKVKKGTRNFQVKTPNSTASVRGTSLFIHAQENKDTWLAVDEGEVEIIEPESGSMAVVQPCQAVNVRKNKKIKEPVGYAWLKRINWNYDPSKGSVEDASGIDELKSLYD